MKRLRTIGLLVLSVVVLMLTVACGGGEPVTMSEVPVYPNAEPMAAGENSMADMLSETLSGAVGEQLSSEINLYRLPADADWPAIEEFYTNELADTDWEAAEELAQQNEAINVTGWSRGGFASEQVLMIAYSPDMLGEGAFMIVALFSE
jgi:hypothetical protein